ncbi:MAG: diacylglycerol/lipid kinase family protein [Actinomycetota bacterium]
MASPFGRARIIINPRAGRGAVERGLPAVRRVLDDGGVEHDVTITEQPGHATEAARRAIDEGCTFVVAVGGDGTVHEVVNGLMDEAGPRNPAAVLGVVAAGSGCDFVKTFGLPQDPAGAAGHLLGDNLWGKIDVGRIRCTGRDGEPHTRWFVNIAEAGIGAEVVDAASRMPKWLGASVYKIAALKGIARFKPRAARIEMYGRETRGKHREDETLAELTRDGTFSMLVVANGQFFGGGMRVAPRAVPGDGLFDVQVSHGPKGESVKAMQKMFKGEHIPSPFIQEFLATRVVVEGDDSILIEADGEVVGTTPAMFEIVPDAIPMKV